MRFPHAGLDTFALEAGARCFRITLSAVRVLALRYHVVSRDLLSVCC